MQILSELDISFHISKRKKHLDGGLECGFGFAISWMSFHHWQLSNLVDEMKSVSQPGVTTLADEGVSRNDIV